MIELRSRRVRLWVVSLPFFVGGLTCRVVMFNFGDIAYGYPYAIVFQFWCYAVGLAVLLASVFASSHWWGRYGGCLWLVLAVACGFTILSTIPK